MDQRNPTAFRGETEKKPNIFRKSIPQGELLCLRFVRFHMLRSRIYTIMIFQNDA